MVLVDVAAILGLKLDAGFAMSAVMALAIVAAQLWNGWKNRNFTWFAQQTQRVLDAAKDAADGMGEAERAEFDAAFSAAVDDLLADIRARRGKHVTGA